MRISDWSSDVCSSDLGPGQMIAVDLKEGRLYHDRELKDKVAALRPFGKWQKKITSLDGVLRSGRGEKAVMAREALRRRQVAVGWSMEDLEMILHPMVEDQKEAVGSMGDDSPIAVLSVKYRGLHHFFRDRKSTRLNSSH